MKRNLIVTVERIDQAEDFFTALDRAEVTNSGLIEMRLTFASDRKRKAALKVLEAAEQNGGLDFPFGCQTEDKA